MKCKLNCKQTLNDTNHPLHGQEAPVGTVLDRADAFWLCGVYQQILRQLNDETFDLVQMDGLEGHALKYVADPADQECLDECIKRGFRKPGTKLATTSPVTPVVTPPVNP